MKNKITISLITLLFLSNHVSIAQSINTFPTSLPAYAIKYNNTMFGENVFIFDPIMDMKEIQTLIDTLYNQQHPRISEFGLKRYALLFKPGTCQLDLKIGYYMHILGLGESPDDVVINGVLVQ